MTLLYVVLGILFIIVIYKTGINLGSILGLIIGGFIGSSLGVAGGGAAVGGIFVFGALGFIIGGLLYKRSKRNR